MLTVGTSISGHRIEGLLGEGGMATVYEAQQISLKRVVALKVLTSRLGADPDFRERFRRECHIQARLDHPNIVPIYEAGEGEHGLWLTMRLVRGPTLHELLVRERLSPDRALEILAPVARALDVAHENGLIHRDITPQNILIDERGHPYLSDFGITKGRGDRSLTRTGQFVGTLDYVAPEQIRDEPSAAATDIYALTAILFECLTGRVPFDKQSEAAILYAHVAEDPPRASSINGALSAAIDSVLETGLAKLPNDRYPRATDLIDAAEEALREPDPEPAPVAIEPAVVPVAEDPPLAAPPRRRWPLRRALVPAMAALALAAAALGVGAATAVDSHPRPLRVIAGDLAIDAPQGWAATKRKRSGIPGLPLTDPVSLAPEDNPEGESVVVGISPATGKTLLPDRFQSASGGPARGTGVALGSLEALRYEDLRGQQPGDGLAAAFVSPVDTGVATVACRRPRPSAAFSRLCARLASTLQLVHGEAFPLGPSPKLAMALQRQFAALGVSRGSLRRRLAAAGSATRQAAAAAGLAAAFRRTARDLSRLKVTPQSAAGLAALVSALRSTRDAYKDLATAARREDSPGFESVGKDVTAKEGVVDRRLRALRPLGYRVGASG